MAPLASNSRAACEGVMKGAASSEPVLSCEQEYVVVHPAYPTLVPVGPAYRSKNRRSRLQRGARSSSSGGSSTSHGNQHQRPKGSHSKASTHLHHHSQHYDEGELNQLAWGLGLGVLVVMGHTRRGCMSVGLSTLPSSLDPRLLASASKALFHCKDLFHCWPVCLQTPLWRWIRDRAACASLTRR